MGVTPSDACGLPMCRLCHQRRHDTGVVTFWTEVIGDVPESYIGAHRRRYLTERREERRCSRSS